MQKFEYQFQILFIYLGIVPFLDKILCAIMIHLNFITQIKLHLLLAKLSEIEALLPSGRQLRSTTVSPNNISFSNQNPNVIPPVGQNFLTFSWQSQSTYTFYDIRILVIYYKKENGLNVRYEKEIPIGYSLRGGEEFPIYPPAARQTVVSFPMNVVTKFMQNISAGDNNKSNYSVEIKPKVEVLVMDEALSRYYSSTSQSLNDLTVRLDENDYTNIEGGLRNIRNIHH